MGTKCDLISERKVSFSEATKLAASINAPYIEISSKDSTNCELAVAVLAQRMRTRRKEKRNEIERNPTQIPKKSDVKPEKCQVQ